MVTHPVRTEASLDKRIVAALIAAALLVVWARYAFGHTGILEVSGRDPVGRDFFNFHTGGRAAGSGDVGWLYDHTRYGAYVAEYGITNSYAFSYPPHALLVFAPFGALPYKAGYALWALGGFAAWLTVAMRIVPSAAVSHQDRSGRSTALPRPALPLSALPLPVWTAALFAPAVLLSFFGGQTGLWVAALMGGGLLAMDRRPVLAGVLFGILTVKPQLGLILAPVLLARGEWAVIVAATLTAVGLVATSLIAFGIAPWTAFLTDTAAFQMLLVEERIGMFDYMVLTPFRSLNLLGIGSTAAMWAHVALSVGVLAMVLLLCRRRTLPVVTGLVLMATAIVSPYFAVYDLTLIALAVLLLWSYVGRVARVGLLVAMMAPLTMVLSMFALPPALTGVVTLALVGVFLRIALDLHEGHPDAAGT